MKRLVGILFLVILSGCRYNKFEDIDVVNKPIVQTITIAELNDFVGKGAIKYNYALKGVVTSSDKEGNFFKQLYIQDNTGAIELSLGIFDIYSLYNRFDSVAVEVGMLSVGVKGNVKQIGYATAGSKLVYPITSAAIIYQTVFKQNGKNEKVGKKVEISEINPSMAGMTVFIDGTFRNSNGTYSGLQPFVNGNATIIVNTSQYATFASKPLPKTLVRLRGIVFYDGDNLMIKLVDLSDVTVI